MRRFALLFLLLLSVFSANPLAAQTDVPEIQFDSVPNLLKFPEHIYMGEGAGVATNSKGNIFVFMRSGRSRLSHPAIAISSGRSDKPST